jgi:hypothetical protein
VEVLDGGGPRIAVAAITAETEYNGLFFCVVGECDEDRISSFRKHQKFVHIEIAAAKTSKMCVSAPSSPRHPPIALAHRRGEQSDEGAALYPVIPPF